MKKRWAPLVLSMLLLASGAGAATQFYGFDFPDEVRVAEQSLRLNGVGGRSVPVIYMRVFAAALYLPEKSTNPEAIMQMKGAKRIQIRMAYGVEAKEFKKALIRGIEKNHNEAQRAQLQARTDAFAAIIDSFGTSKKGDTINMDFIPSTGLVISVNGQNKGQPIAGEDFFNAVTRIFLGQRPAEPELKARMLGLKK